jgi:predicted Rossmann-fold nucleotide-binding protein
LERQGFASIDLGNSFVSGLSLKFGYSLGIPEMKKGGPYHENGRRGPAVKKTDIESRSELKAFLADPARDWSKTILHGVNLRRGQLQKKLLKEKPTGSVLIGCVARPKLTAHFARYGALIVPPAPPSTGFKPFRTKLYSAKSLLKGFDPANPETSYRKTYDWRAYRVSMDPKKKVPLADLPADAVMFERLHDYSIEYALRAFLQPASGTPRKVVAIMGGHERPRAERLDRADSPYMQIALLAWRLARSGLTIATGGGPGAMEAGNLGAWFAGRPEKELRAAVRILAAVPTIQPIPGSDFWNSGDWMAPAFRVMAAYPLRRTSKGTEKSLGVPTWFYGHEPPNPFATHIAKYFQNSIREDGLLTLANRGVIFAEGSGGTVQEIFQDACLNYYATPDKQAPMVLFGSDYWNPKSISSDPAKDKRKPAYPLLLKLAQEKKFDYLLKLTDSIDDVVAHILNPPKPSQ